MALQYVKIPLFEDSFYSYSIALENVTYVLSFKYVERMELWIFDLYDAESNPLVLGMGLVPFYPISLDYVISELSGYFWLEQIADINTEQYKQYPEELSQYYRMFYIYDDGE